MGLAQELGLLDPSNEEDDGAARRHNRDKLLAKMRSVKPPGWGQPKVTGSQRDIVSMALEGTSFLVQVVYVVPPFVVYAIRDYNKNGGKFDSIEAAINSAEGQYARWVLEYPEKRIPDEGTPLHNILVRIGKPTEHAREEARRQNRDVLPSGQLTPEGCAKCPKCAGYGNLPSYGHVAEGVCFTCKGQGYIRVRKSVRWNKSLQRFEQA